MSKCIPNEVRTMRERYDLARAHFEREWLRGGAWKDAQREMVNAREAWMRSQDRAAERRTLHHHDDREWSARERYLADAATDDPFDPLDVCPV
ncbi:MAG: hypothetical protein AAGE52_30345 [Myxococcota bacterium]